MKKITSTSVLVVLFTCANFYYVKAQENPQELTIKLESIVSKSPIYNNYRLIDEGIIGNFESELNDYFVNEQNEKTASNKKLNENVAHILALQNQIKKLEKENQDFQSNQASFGFFDSKKASSKFVLILFLFFVVTSIVFYLKFKKANEVTKSSKLVLQDLEDEYEVFRRACIEREQNLRRQLFNEIKKSNELKDAS